MQNSNQPIHYLHVTSSHSEENHGSVIVETPVSLTVNGELWLTLNCTPADLEALAVGFLFNEGLLFSADDVADIRVCPQGDNVDIWLHHPVEKPSSWRRTSGCTGGVTGLASETENQYPISEDNIQLTPTALCDLMSQLLEAQSLYRQSGGIHTSALSDGRRILVVAEDIGRHNTLDKIAGKCLLEGKLINPGIILSTGRISSDMLQKSARIGACMVISRTAASYLAIQMAESRGITLIGYTRRDRFNIYTHAQRIILPVTARV